MVGGRCHCGRWSVVGGWSVGGGFVLRPCYLTLSNLGGGGGIRLNGELFSITPKRLKIL